MKRAKKATPKVKTEIVKKESYEIKCPHCSIHFQGEYDRQSVRIICPNCNNLIDIVWDKAVNVIHF